MCTQCEVSVHIVLCCPNASVSQCDLSVHFAQKTAERQGSPPPGFQGSPPPGSDVESSVGLNVVRNNVVSCAEDDQFHTCQSISMPLDILVFWLEASALQWLSKRFKLKKSRHKI